MADPKAASADLTMEQRERILRDVSLGVPAPDNEAPAAQAWRAKMTEQVEQMRDQGMMNEIPWNP